MLLPGDKRCIYMNKASTQTAILLGNSVTDPDTGWHICGSLFKTEFSNVAAIDTRPKSAQRKKISPTFLPCASLSFHTCVRLIPYTCHACIHPASNDDIVSNAAENESTLANVICRCKVRRRKEWIVKDDLVESSLLANDIRERNIYVNLAFNSRQMYDH